MVSPKFNDVYSITINNFIPKIEFSNFKALNTLYYDFIKEQKYDLECDLLMSNPKINNLNYISDLSEKYKPKIDKAKTDLYINPNYNMVYYKDVSIPDENLEIINRCILFVGSIFEGYTINLSNKYDYPSEVKLAHFNTSFNDTLFYSPKPNDNSVDCSIYISLFSDNGVVTIPEYNLNFGMNIMNLIPND